MSILAYPYNENVFLYYTHCIQTIRNKQLGFWDRSETHLGSVLNNFGPARGIKLISSITLCSSSKTLDLSTLVFIKTKHLVIVFFFT